MKRQQILIPGKLYRVVQDGDRLDDELLYFATAHQAFNFSISARFDPLIHTSAYVEFNNTFFYMGTEKFYDVICHNVYYFHKFYYNNKTLFFPCDEEFVEIC